MVTQLLPHIRQFVRVRQALVRAAARNNTTTVALLENSRIGVVHLDRRGRILEVNDRALSILRHGDRLSDREGMLSARRPADEDRLKRVVGDALPASASPAVSGSMRLHRSAVLQIYRKHSISRQAKLVRLVRSLDGAVLVVDTNCNLSGGTDGVSPERAGALAEDARNEIDDDWPEPADRPRGRSTWTSRPHQAPARSGPSTRHVTPRSPNAKPPRHRPGLGDRPPGGYRIIASP